MDGSHPYGRRLMPTILHLEAKNNPQRTFAIAAKSENIEGGFREVTFQQIAHAVNHVSHWLRRLFEDGNEPPRHATIAYIGVPDLRYNIIFLAAVQCRYQVFLPSPRNPSAVNLSLLEQTQCSRLVYSAEVKPVAHILHEGLAGLQCEPLPSLNELLAAPATEYSYDLKYEDVYREPILILHSSGSTGQPKPVTNTHGTFATYDIRDWPTVPGRVNHDGLSTLRFSQPNGRIYDVFPPFHIAGFMTKIMAPLYNLTAPIFGPPLRPPSGALAAEMIRLHRPCGAVIPPSITEQLYHEHGGSDLFGQLDVLLFAGGPLPQVVGDEVSKHTTLCQFYGSTEMGQVRQLIPLSEDWSYIHFHPNERLELQEAGEDMFELVVFADKGSEGTSSLYHNYPDIREWRTKDLFRRHPSKPNLWKFHARKDDILVFSSGEKLNPIPMESSVTAIPGVSGALVVGQGQPQAALLVELSHETVFLGGALQELWPIIDRANSLLPGHGRISRSMIIIADAKKPFARAGKGTVVRRLTEEIYATEIENLYQVASPKAGQVAVSLKSSLLSDRDVQGFVRLILSQLSVEEQLGDDENFYAYGMDSVKTSEAVGHLKASLLRYKPEASLAWVSGEVLYRNPTIKQLSAIILDFLIHGITPKRRDRVAEMQAKIADQLSDLPRDLANSGVNHDLDKYSIAITGTTGFLGAQLLAKLSENPRISRIYCLNRSLISTARGIFGQRSQPSTAEVVFLRINFASPKLGLSTEDYTRLLEDCTIIVHNAWHVDFNLALPSFEENVRSTKQLISLSATSKLRPRIVFISSISSTGVFAPQDSPRKTIPEGIVEDLSTTMNIGYAESKHVAEHVLSRSGVPATIIRMGQLAPSSIEGTCPKDDVVSVFLQTCKTSKMLASDFVDLVNWVPVDQAAAIVSEIVQAQIVEKEALQFYNVVHPRPQSWSSVIDTVRAWCGEETRIVSMTDWVDELQQAEVRNPQVHEGLPALRMLAMYGIIASRGPTHEYATKNLMGLSEAMRRLDPVDSHQIETWLRQI